MKIMLLAVKMIIIMELMMINHIIYITCTEYFEVKKRFVVVYQYKNGFP